MPMSAIRLAAKAVIVSDGAILLTRNLHPDDPDGDFYLLPGGGQRHGESLTDCLRREVREETGYPLIVGDVLWIRDYIGASHEFAEYERDVHQVEVMFSCSIDATAGPSEPTEPDAWQLSVDWVPIARLSDLRFFPSALVPRLVALAARGSYGPHYLGDVN
ncbi:MAG: NUDIX domain-containing protein [Gammaproteobacteria bacterium]|nr:NUDIX domain-containing protein [Gammaproteobacteria bacterium]